MRKLLLCTIALLLIVGFSLYSLDGRITAVRGKVEVRSGFGSWRTARVGDVLPQGGSISTGFNSRAEINLGSSVLQVSQLTRMTLEELAEEQGTRTTSLNLKVGKVRAEIKTTKGISHNFKLKSSVSTAAVRGTAFTYDGEMLEEITDGSVSLQNKAGQSRSVGVGEESQVTGGGLAPPPSAENTQEENSTVSPYTAPVQDGPQVLPPPVSEPTTPTTGTVTVQWEDQSSGT